MDIKTRQNGFTLIELMITIVIVAVLLSLAGPSFVETIRTNRIQTNTDTLYTSLITARSEALKRNQHVAMCRSSDGATCASSGGWEQGWLMYADEDADNTLDAGLDPEPIINVYGELLHGYTLRTGSNFTNRVVYRQDGSSSQIDTFVLCDSEANLATAREIVVSNVGRPRLSKTTTDCTP
jgi:type IV fimbrial biogenesis protein FimT